ncbi:SDR family oxidoreductase [Bacillus sp. HMF5848]|uniref:SDR family oxidoreductase n=1 Tax=Bacillus sp. HMF5848 TaxID=2495421 RepID=UPI000F772BEC|nr:SDR family oxidoreductase [Bacillus sp. HMF5848]RSK25762.1 SDR family oxidoreductase [Bacillus sp. HMF5848]
MQLTGKVALVTGGSKGLGRVISMQIAAAGAKVYINYAHDSSAANEVVRKIEQNSGQAEAIQGDVTNEGAVLRMIDEIGDIDILVNNATGPQPELSIEESDWQAYLDQLEFFVKAPLLLTKAVLPCMKRKNSGRIINIGSEVVQIGNANFGNYVTAKSAQLGMTRSWANELGPYGITVNIVNPGFIPVERHADVKQDSINFYAEGTALKRIGVPQDIANSVVFLASDQASFITGQVLSVNGGNTFGI